MKVIQDTVGETQITFQAFDEELEISAEVSDIRTTQPTGIIEEVQNSYIGLKNLIREISQDIGNEVRTIDSRFRPATTELEFALTLSAQTGIWVISGQGDYTVKITLSWESQKD